MPYWEIKNLLISRKQVIAERNRNKRYLEGSKYALYIRDTFDLGYVKVTHPLKVENTSLLRLRTRLNVEL